jgi:hypothetical protein
MKLCTALIVATAGASIEERLLALESHTAALESHTIALKADNIALKAGTVALKNSRIQVSEGLIGEIRMFGLDSCPGGWEEATNMQGRIPVFRPTGGLPLQVFGNPLKVNETNRVGPHAHPATVKDPGHVHKLPIRSDGNLLGADSADTGPPFPNAYSSLSAKTGITVSIGDITGEAYPLVYVVVCTPI